MFEIRNWDDCKSLICLTYIEELGLIELTGKKVRDLDDFELFTLSTLRTTPTEVKVN